MGADPLIVLGTGIGTSAYGVDTEEIQRRAGEIDGVVERLSGVVGGLRRAQGRLAPRAHLAAGGWAVVGRIEEAIGRIVAQQQEAAKLASSVRIAAARYELAEAAARERIPAPGLLAPATMRVPLLFGPLRSLAEWIDRPQFDHALWAQALRMVPREVEVEAPGALPMPLAPLMSGMRTGEAVLRGMMAGFGMGQRHPGGAGAGHAVREVANGLMPHTPGSTVRVARSLAFALGPSTRVDVYEVEPPAGTSSEPVSTVAGALETLAPLYPDAGGAPGGFRIDKLTAPDGSVAWEVFVPGSQGVADSNPLSWRNNPAAFIGLDAASTQMVFTAMRAVGVKPTQPVVVTGHSQGGMVAVNVANHPRAKEYSIEGVITAGSPISNLAAPEGLTLALEHTEDPVPGLDDASNAVEPGTVTVERPLHASSDPLDQAVTDATGSHDLPAYVRTAELVDASQDPRILQMTDLLERIAPEGVQVESRYFQGVEPEPVVRLPGPFNVGIGGGPGGWQR